MSLLNKLKGTIGNAVSDGIGKGVRGAVGKAVESVVQPAADKLAGQAANQLNQTTNDMQAAAGEYRTAQTQAQILIQPTFY